MIETGKKTNTDLLTNTLLWRAREIVQKTAEVTGIPTGFERLDQLFYDNGWPRAALTELLCDTYGIGELRLMAPGLARLSSHESRWIAWINPPFVPYAPALKAFGIDTDKILLIHPRNHKEAMWAFEKALQSGTCSAALAWLDESKLKLTDLRRIQVRAKQGRTWANLFRPTSAVQNPSSAELRLRVDCPSRIRHENQRNEKVQDPRPYLSLSIVKRRGGWAVPDIPIELDEVVPGPLRGLRNTSSAIDLSRHLPSHFEEQLSLWRQSRREAQPDENRSAKADLTPGIAGIPERSKDARLQLMQRKAHRRSPQRTQLHLM